MRFTRKVKKALSVVLTGALVVAGVNFGMTKAVAEDEKYVDNTFKVCGTAITDFAGDGTYTQSLASAAWSTWEASGLYNLGAFEADREFAISDVSLQVNGTYTFQIPQDKIEHKANNNEAGELQSYKADLPNAWSDGYAKDEAIASTADNSASLVFSYDKSVTDAFSVIKLKVGGTETKVTSYSITFTYQFKGSTEKEPEVVLPQSGIYFDWTGMWQKQEKTSATVNTSKAENAKVVIDIGEWAVTISKIDLSCMEKPIIEVGYVANDDKLQIMDADWKEFTINQGKDSVIYDLSDYKNNTLILSSKSNKLIISSISIYNDTVDCAKVKIANNISAAEALTQADYTADSWTALQTALTAAKAVAADASLADINAANKALKDAIAGLKAAGTSTPTPAPGVPTPTPVPGGNATPTPAPGGDATPTPAPGGETTPTPAPGGDTTPTPAPGGDTTPTPAPGGDATPTPAPGGDATPTPAPGGDATPTPTPGGNATSTPAPNGDNTPTTVGLAKNAKATVGNFTYKVTKTSVKSAGKVTKGTVTVTAMSKKGKKAKKLSVPATVKAGGATYNVTAVGAKAMKGAKATSVTMGKNVKSIGKSAFASCKKLSKLFIKAKLSSVAKGAFKGCKKKIKVSGTAKKQNVKKLKKSGYKKFK